MCFLFAVVYQSCNILDIELALTLPRMMAKIHNKKTFEQLFHGTVNKIDTFEYIELGLFSHFAIKSCSVSMDYCVFGSSPRKNQVK